MVSYEKQLEQFSEANENSLTFIVGDKGLGKSYFIHSYFKDFENVLYIKDQIFKSYFLEPIITAISQLDNNFKIEQDDLNMPHMIRKILLDICRNKSIVMCFESFNSYPEDLAEFCISFLQAYLDCNKNNNVFILIELDSDVNGSENTWVQKLYSLTINTNFIKFREKNEDELFEIISSKFNNKIYIGEKERKYIIKSSFGNIMHLFIIINYLKQEGYIHFDGTKWICERLPRGILNQSIEEYIKHRYNRLNDDLKILLQKSSLLGPEFYSNQLQKTFNLVRVDEELSRIEKLSSLIQKNDNYDQSKYLFETEDVCNNIQNLIPDDERIIWNKMLAEYYELQYRKHDQNMIKRLENCCRLAIYYINCNDIEKAIIFHFRSIRYSIYLLDYKGALELISSLVKIPNIRNTNKNLYFEVLKLQAYCQHQLGKYELSTELYFELFNKPFAKLEIMEISYFYADSLYFIGRVSEAQNILLTLKEELKSNYNNKLLFRILSELATTYGFFREYGAAREYFSYSVNQCRSAGLKDDYFVQLRKSSMFWDLKMTIPLMEQAVEYFEEKNNIQELAKTYHNLGTDSLYLGNSETAINYLNQAIKEFQKYGSDEIHYTYNCIGVYYAAYETNFEKAIEYFQKSISFRPVLFSTMVLYLNISSCYKALQNNNKSVEYLEKAKQIQSELGNEVPSYLLYLLINQGLYAKLDKRLKESEHYFQESLKYKLTNNQLYLVGKNLSEVSRNLDKDTLKYASLEAEPLYKQFYKNNICLSTLRFWE